MGRLMHNMRMPHWFLIVGWLALAGCQGGALEYDDPGKTDALPAETLSDVGTTAPSAPGEDATVSDDTVPDDAVGHTSTVPEVPVVPDDTSGATDTDAATSVAGAETTTGEGTPAEVAPPPFQPPLGQVAPPAGTPPDAERAAPGESDEAFRKRQSMEKSLDTSTALAARRRETLAAGSEPRVTPEATRTDETGAVATREDSVEAARTVETARSAETTTTRETASTSETTATRGAPVDAARDGAGDRTTEPLAERTAGTADTTRPEPGAARTTDDTARTDEIGAAATRGGVSTSGAATTRDATTDTTDTTRATDTATEPISDTTTARTVETEQSAETTTVRDATSPREVPADTAHEPVAGAPEGTRDATTSDTTATATARDIVPTGKTTDHTTTTTGPVDRDTAGVATHDVIATESHTPTVDGTDARIAIPAITHDATSTTDTTRATDTGVHAGSTSAWDLLTHAGTPDATRDTATGDETASHADTTVTPDASHPDTVTAETRDTGATATHDTAATTTHPEAVTAAASHPTTVASLPRDGSVPADSTAHSTDPSTTVSHDVPVSTADQHATPDGFAEAAVTAHPETTTGTSHDGTADTVTAGHPSTPAQQETHATSATAAHDDAITTTHPETVSTATTHPAAAATPDAHPESTATVELHPTDVTAASHPAGTTESALPHDTVAKTAAPHETGATTDSHGTTADTSHPVASLDPSVFEAAVAKQAIIPAPAPSPEPEPAAPQITITPKNFSITQPLELPIDSVDKDFIYIKASAGPDYDSELDTYTANPYVIVQSDTPPEVTLECKDFQNGPMVAQQEVVQFAGAYALLMKFRYPRATLKGNQPDIIAAAPQCTFTATAGSESATLPLPLRLRGRPPVIYGKKGLLETTMDAKMHTHVTLYIHKLWGDVAQASASKDALIDPVFKVADWNLDVVQDPVYTSCTPALAGKSTLNGIAGSFGEYKIIPVYSVEQIKPQNNTTHDCIVMVKDKQQNTGTLHLTLHWVIPEPAATDQTAESGSGNAAQDVPPTYWNPPQAIEPVNFALNDTLWLVGDVTKGWQSKLDGAIDDMGTKPIVRVTGSPNAPMYQLNCVSGLYPPFAGKFTKQPTPTGSVGDYYRVDLSYDFSKVQYKSLLTHYYCTAKAYNGVDPDKALGMHFEIAPHMLVADPEMETTPNEGKTSDNMGGFFDLDIP